MPVVTGFLYTRQYLLCSLPTSSERNERSNTTLSPSIAADYSFVAVGVDADQKGWIDVCSAWVVWSLKIITPRISIHRSLNFYRRAFAALTVDSPSLNS